MSALDVEEQIARRIAHGGGAALRLATITLLLDVGTKQDLYTVPAGKKLVSTMLIFREPSEDLTGLADGIDCGTDAGGGNLGNLQPFAVLNTTAAACIGIPDYSNSVDTAAFQRLPVLAAGSVLGLSVLDTSLAGATLTVELFGYLIDE